MANSANSVPFRHSLHLVRVCGFLPVELQASSVTNDLDTRLCHVHPANHFGDRLLHSVDAKLDRIFRDESFRGTLNRPKFGQLLDHKAPKHPPLALALPHDDGVSTLS